VAARSLWGGQGSCQIKTELASRQRQREGMEAFHGENREIGTYSHVVRDFSIGGLAKT